MTIGETIKTARQGRKWSQEELAARSGVSRNHVAGVERGGNVSIDLLEKIAAALDLRELPLGKVRLVATQEAENFLNASFLELVAQQIESNSRLLRDHLSGYAAYSQGAEVVSIRDGRETGSPATPRIKNPDIFTMDLPDNAPFRHASIDEILDGEMVDVAGYVAAGPGGLDYTPKGEKVYLPRNLLPSGDEKVLIAKGESMIDVGINDGDIVIVAPRKAGVAARGELVIAWYNGGIVIKEWQRRPGKIFQLVSHNVEVPPITITAEDIDTGNFELQAIVRRWVTPSWNVKFAPKIS